MEDEGGLRSVWLQVSRDVPSWVVASVWRGVVGGWCELRWPPRTEGVRGLVQGIGHELSAVPLSLEPPKTVAMVSRSPCRAP